MTGVALLEGDPHLPGAAFEEGDAHPSGCSIERADDAHPPGAPDLIYVI